jgi:hypothetical protein
MFQAMLRVVIHSFGQKTTPAVVNIDQLVDIDKAEQLYVHVGIDFHPKEKANTLLWSRLGLENMSRDHGDLYPALSLIDCANFVVRASDGRLNIDVQQPLADIWKTTTLPGTKVFALQLYNSTPCYRPKEYHAVSGLLVSSGSFHPQVCL